MRKTMIFSLLALLISLPLVSHADDFPTNKQIGGEKGWQQIIKAQQDRVKESQQKLQQAEGAQGADRIKFMQEHMKMMEDHIASMSKMIPPKNMSSKDHDKWMAEHEKLMQGLLDQMKRSHAMMQEMMKK